MTWHRIKIRIVNVLAVLLSLPKIALLMARTGAVDLNFRIDDEGVSWVDLLDSKGKLIEACVPPEPLRRRSDKIVTDKFLGQI